MDGLSVGVRQLTEKEEERWHKGKAQGKSPTPTCGMRDIDDQIDHLQMQKMSMLPVSC